MMNSIQKLIELAEARKKSHEKKFYEKDELYHEGYYSGRGAECDFFIQKLKLLLKNTDDAQFRKLK